MDMINLHLQKNFYQIGKIQKVQGLKGLLKVSFEAFFLDFLIQAMEEKPLMPIDLFPHFFIEINNNKLPYFVESLKLTQKNGALLKLEEVDSREQAQDLHQKYLYIQQTQAPDIESFIEDEEEDYWDYLLGFELHTSFSEHPNLGKILNIIYLPKHELAQVDYQNEEILVPLHEDFIQYIDEDKQIICMNIPDGLLDMYLKK